MDSAIASAGEKLALAEHPITVLKNKYALLDLQQAMETLQRGAAEYVAPLPNWMPGWLKRVLARSRPPRPTPSLPAPFIQKKIDAAKKRMEELQAKNILEATLTPLTMADDYEINAHFYKIRKQVLASFDEPEVTPEGKQAREEAVEVTGNLTIMAKRIHCMLKQKDHDGAWVRALTFAEVRKIDPRILLEIWNEYEKHFVLTDDELGK